MLSGQEGRLRRPSVAIPSPDEARFASLRDFHHGLLGIRHWVDLTIALEMLTPLERAAPAQLTFWINGSEAATGTVRRTVPATFTASETFDVGVDTGSPVADDYFERAPFEFEGSLVRLHFANLAPAASFSGQPDD